MPMKNASITKQHNFLLTKGLLMCAVWKVTGGLVLHCSYTTDFGISSYWLNGLWKWDEQSTHTAVL